MNKSEFKVRVYHEELGERPIEAKLSFVMDKIRLSSRDPKSETDWGVENLKIEKGGANKQLFLLTHPSKPGWVIYVRDYSIIQAIKQKFPHKKIPRKNILSTGLSLALAPIILVLVFLVAAYNLRVPTLNYIINKIPVKYEEKLGEVALKQLVSLSDLNNYSESSKKITRLFDPLLKQGKDQGYNFKVYIVGSSQVNAFALPGGYLVFNQGLLMAADSPEEILGVAAHEMAHVVRRHSLRQLISTIGTYGIVQLVLGDFSGLIAVIADNSTFLLSRMYSRQSEAEADEEGLNYLINAKINPQAMVSFFEKLKKQAEEQKKAMLEGVGMEDADVKGIDLSFISTHPDIDERIVSMRQKIEKHEVIAGSKYKSIEFNLKQFKQELSGSMIGKNKRILKHSDTGKDDTGKDSDTGSNNESEKRATNDLNSDKSNSRDKNK